MTLQKPIRIERLIALFLIGFFALYALFEGYKIIAGPKLEIISPENGATINSNTVMIEGKTRNISFIALNDRQIFVDENGVFREKLVLPAGYTIIKIAAEDRFKSRVEEKIALWRPRDLDRGQSISELLNTSTSTATSTADMPTNTATSSEE